LARASGLVSSRGIANVVAVTSPVKPGAPVCGGTLREPGAAVWSWRARPSARGVDIGPRFSSNRWSLDNIPTFLPIVLFKLHPGDGFRIGFGNRHFQFLQFPLGSVGVIAQRIISHDAGVRFAFLRAKTIAQAGIGVAQFEKASSALLYRGYDPHIRIVSLSTPS